MSSVFPSLERTLVSVVSGALLATLVAPLPRAFGLPPVVGFTLAALVLGSAIRLLPARLPTALDGAARVRPREAIVLACAALVAIVENARVALYVLEPSLESASVVLDPFYVHHNCFSAYYLAAGATRQHVTNLYDESLYETTGSAFKADSYYYPPPFLLLPRAVTWIARDFLAARALWFVLEGSIVALALVIAARWIGAREGRAVGLASVLFLASTTTALTLQVGNFQIAAFAIAVLAMIAFHEERNALGGALLAFVALAKIFPGILGIYLLAQRRWRAAAITLVFALVYLIAALLLLGNEPFVAFFRHDLPQLATGSAFVKRPAITTLNHSMAALPLKIGLVFSGASMKTASVFLWIYTTLLVAIAVYVARRIRPQGRLELLLVVLALVHLASLRSPFVPDTYALIGPAWIASLLLGSESLRVDPRRRQSALLLTYGGLQLLAPITSFLGKPWSIPAMLAYTSVAWGASLILVVAALRRARMTPALPR